MKKLFLCLLLLSSWSAHAQSFQTPESFAQLDSIVVDREDLVLAYVPKGSLRLDPKLVIGDPMMDDDYVRPVAQVKFGAEPAANLLLCYTDLPSDDPTFLFFRETKTGKYEHLCSVWGKQIFIPGNGYVYISGHANNLFDQKRKYKFEGDTLREIAQPFYAVGLKTKTLKTIKLYSDRDQRDLLATVPAQAAVEIVAADFSQDIKYFLVKTSFGLLGWWKLDNWFSEEIQGLFYAGD